MDLLAPLIGFLGFFTMVGWIVHVVVDGRRRRERLKIFTDFHSRLLDRIGSAREFGEFLQTEGGTRFLASLSVEGTGAQRGILRSVQFGVVLLALGSGFLLLGRTYVFDEGGFTIVGTIVLSIAIGFLLSAALSLVLSRRLGLLGGEADRSA
jgi:hypothetical protein